ncbi:ATP-binding cassette domain-containing protein [Streptacidiphilus griseoplanus]|uniref:ATP-binding cassette domain-containing protein n=1 Tax=Peterkaempfera griseoplana TaxID=66896 RepID=UPI0006E253E3|nr:ATP-binding cassette domain-containing protein [Peterkaempfera griseoplana]
MTDPEGGAAVAARSLSLRGPRGWVYREVDLTAGPGALVAVEGPAGSGRTALLLTLAGRMRPSAGDATVAGLHLPRQAAKVRRIAALGPMPGVNQLDPALTVGEHIRERGLLHAPVRSLLLRRGDQRSAAALATTGFTAEGLPRGLRTPVRELDALRLLRLATGLALTGRPRLLCVDDIDDRLHATDRDAAWHMLHQVARSGVTVLAATTDATAAGGLAEVTVRLPGDTGAQPAADATGTADTAGTTGTSETTGTTEGEAADAHA